MQIKLKHPLYTISAMVLAFPHFVNAQFKQVVIAKNMPADELAIAVNPLFPNQVICATSAGFYFSNLDTARTWQRRSLASGELKKYRNPLVFWTQQDPWYSYLSWKDTIIMSACFQSAPVCAGNSYHVSRMSGKIIERLMIHPEAGTKGRHAVWTQLDNAGSKDKKDSSFIFYAFSNRLSDGWDKTMRISVYGGDCSMGDSTLMGATCCTGPGDEVYAAWAGPQGLMFRNLSDGKMTAEKIIMPIKNGWQYKIGKKILSNGLPTIACDNSNGSYRGRLYMCWSDERHGVNNKNVFLIYSDDRGENWTEPIVLTYRPNHKEQFMPAMTVDQNTGCVYIIYYDQQNSVDGQSADLYLAQSRNGGLKFDYYRINTKPIQPHPSMFFGKYSGLSAVNGIVRPVWMQPDGKNKTCVLTALIDEKALSLYNKNYSDDIEMAKTFLWSDKIRVDFVLKKKGAVSAVITEPLEPGFETIIVKNKKMRKGKNDLLIDTKKLGIKKGNYTLTLYHDRKNTFTWIIEE